MNAQNTLLLSLLCGCAMKGGPPPEVVPSEAPPEVRNVILFIGDGMGPQQVGLFELFATRAPNTPYDGPTTLHQIMDAGEVGVSRHDPADGLVVDSACSASQLATGQPSRSESIGLDVHGQPVLTVLELAKQQGMATGLISDTRITHATPAAFAAHVAHREMENEIAVGLLETQPDILLSGGLRYFIPQSTNTEGSDARTQVEQMTGGAVSPLKSKRTDERNLLLEAQEAGYSLAFDRDSLGASGNQVLGLFAYSEMEDGITYHSRTEPGSQPSLAEMTSAALQRLSEDEDGFFLMVEGGQIDWAAHSNDAGQLLHEMVKFDEALAVAWTFAQGREDTLLVVTADHETGGMGMSYSRANVPEAQVIEGGMFEQNPYAPYFNFGNPSQLDQIYAQKQTFFSLLLDFRALPEEERTAQNLMERFNAISEFPITESQAAAVLASEPNHYHVPGHAVLDVEEFPRFEDFEAFYAFGEMSRADLFARQIADGQNIVWATGTHTHTPVYVISHGPPHATAPFRGMLHHTEVGQGLMDAIR